MGLRQEIPGRLSEKSMDDLLTAHELALWGVNFHHRKAYIKNRREREVFRHIQTLNRKGRFYDRTRKKRGDIRYGIPF